MSACICVAKFLIVAIKTSLSVTISAPSNQLKTKLDLSPYNQHQLHQPAAFRYHLHPLSASSSRGICVIGGEHDESGIMFVYARLLCKVSKWINALPSHIGNDAINNFYHGPAGISKRKARSCFCCCRQSRKQTHTPLTLAATAPA